MTPFDKAREIIAEYAVAGPVFKNDCDRLEVAHALLAYEPTQSARDAAQYALQYWWSQPGFPELSDDQCGDGVERIASAITIATAASDARVRELEESLHYANGTCDLAMKHRDMAEARVRELEAALEQAHAVLVMLTGPGTIKQTNAMQAWAQAVEAELEARRALGGAK